VTGGSAADGKSSDHPEVLLSSKIVRAAQLLSGTGDAYGSDGFAALWLPMMLVACPRAL
jgi:hypothetical protein